MLPRQLGSFRLARAGSSSSSSGRPSAHLCPVTAVAASSSLARRNLSSTAARCKLAPHKKHRIIPQRDIVVRTEMPRQKSDEELMEEDIQRQLERQAGHSLKTKLKGVKIQTRYLEAQVQRSDKRLMTEAALRDMPELTEAEIDDFYVNLLASGTEIGNLPEVRSPTHKAAQAPTAAHLMGEEEFARLSREEKERVVEERLRTLAAIERRKSRRELLFGSMEAPAAPAEETQASLAAPLAEKVVEKQRDAEGEAQLETVEVRSAAQFATARLEVGEDGESRSASEASTQPSASGPQWSSTQGLRSSLPPRTSQETQPPSQGPALETDPSFASTASGPSTTLGEASSTTNPVAPPRHALQRPKSAPTSLTLPSLVETAPASHLALLKNVTSTVSSVLELEEDARRSQIDIGLMTHQEWHEFITSFLTTDLTPAAPAATERLAPLIAKLDARAEKRASFARRAKRVPHTQLEKGKLALVRKRGDLALEALEARWQSGASVDHGTVKQVTRFLAEGGHAEGLTRLMEFIEKDLHWKVTPELSASLVEVQLAKQDIPAALEALHELEDRSIFVPEPTYHAVIKPLVHSEAPSHRATGWNLFGHMRLVAHGKPSLALYTEMIQACAHPTHPEPERALDLWTELTVDNTIVPDAAAYSATMRACAKIPRFYPEAFQLMRQLLSNYQTALPGTPQKDMYTPTRETFHALLDGARRNGDLPRARWVLTEMIRFSNHPGLAADGAAIGPNTQTLANILRTYANAEPVIARGAFKSVKGKESADEAAKQGEGAQPRIEGGTESSVSPVLVEGVPATGLDSSASASSTSSDSQSRPEVEIPSTSPTPASASSGNLATAPLPQSSPEILNEAMLLFQRALHDGPQYKANPSERSPSGTLPPLRFVHVNVHLANALLNVRYKHDSAQNSIEAFKAIWSEIGLRPNGHSWRQFFVHLAGVDSSHVPMVAREAFELFKRWEKFEEYAKKTFQSQLHTEGPEVAQAFYEDIGYTPANIQRIFAAMIKIMSRDEQLDLARSLIERFMSLYPPSDIIAAVPEPLPSKALVTLVPRVAVRPDPLPPHLLFADVKTLYDRYVKYQQTKSIGWLKWVTMSYQRALARYREARLNQGKEGATRQKEVELAREEARVFREVQGPAAPVHRRLTRRFRELNDMEGVMGDMPPGSTMGKNERRKKVLGEKGLEMYHRARQQRW